MIGAFVQDLKYAARTLRRAPGFALLATLTIAIGVGANAAVFSIVNKVLLRPLPYPRSDDLVLVWQQNKQTKQTYGDVAPANLLDWRVRSHSFTGLAAVRAESFNLSLGDRPERIPGAMVSANFFDVLGVKASLGRTFQAGDEELGAARVVVLADSAWRQQFGGRPDIVGQLLRINDEASTIVGVMAPGIDYPDRAQLWVPPHWGPVPDDPLLSGQNPSTERDHSYFEVVSRLKSGVSQRQAQADMDAVSAGLERDYPDSDQNVSAGLALLGSELVKDVRPTLLLLFAAVALVLLIAAANVSGLLIARATARQQEIAVRVALGASRRRIIGQLLTESVVLAIVGGGCGVLLAMWLVGPLAAMSPSDLGVQEGAVRVDATVLLFGLAVSALVGLVFGLAPARQTLGATVHDDLKETGRQAGGRRQNRIRAVLVMAEIALSLVLLVAAGLTIKSFIRLQHVSTGFDADHVLTLAVSLSPTRYGTPQQKADFWERAIDSLRQVPGIETVGATNRLPLSGGNSIRGLDIDGRQPTPPVSPDYRTASPDYFRALGIPLLRGREFVDQDRENRTLVTVISASMAARVWPSLDPIGHTLSITTGQPITIVGVVGDVHHASLAADPRPTFYVPYRQDPWPVMTFALRTRVAPTSLGGAVREAIWRVDKDQPVGAVLTMDERLSNSLSRRRFSVTLLTAFGAVAVALAAIGLYGVLAFIVAQRRREIGVRMALGATPRAVVRDVLGHGLRVSALGILVGLALASAATRLLSSLLYGTSTLDAATFSGVALLLIVVAAGASLVPALRASRVDPIVALREE